MEFLRGTGKWSTPSATLIVLLLTLSLIGAGPAKYASASTNGSTAQVTATVLPGYKSTGALPSTSVVDVSIGIPLQNAQSLQYLEEQISDPGSPLFHHFLTPSEVQSYLPTTEFNAALAYLENGGFKVVTTGLDSVIVAQGTAAQASEYLGLRYEMYSNGEESYYSASGSSPITGAYLYSSNFTGALLAHPDTLEENLTTSPLQQTHPSASNQTVVSGAYTIPDLQTVYNATSLYARGIEGQGFTVGILDFEGDPYIAGQLQTFDSVYGLPSSPFKVIPIGPYNPSLGTYTGWDIEISLDVESVHSMAPGAGIDLYVANGALPLAADIAAIVQQGLVNDLSQSFIFAPEALYSSFGPSALELNVLLTDEYYMLGSAEGMTFLASTGDVGGSGYAGGPEGTVGYPSTSPYVTAVGGTTTYLDFEGSSVSSFSQTAWSNYGFVPDGINYGGGGGGVSIFEPQPWYQSGLSTPKGFATGRMVPDLSLNANGEPGVTIVIPGNYTVTEGGTSEAVQLLAGLLTLVMASVRSGLGLINPSLYSTAENPSTYAKAYYPITFGYTIPWISSEGYNMATGWGAPNIGEMAGYFKATTSSSLGINVSATVGGSVPQELLPGQTLSISAAIAGTHSVETGSFSASLQTLSGTLATVPLSYDASTKTWVGQMPVPDTGSGISYLTVSGSSNGESGTGFAEFFLGYLATYISPTADTPYAGQFSIPIVANITTLSGEPANGTFSFSALSYSIKSNSYSQFYTSPFTLAFASIWAGEMTGVYPNGPAILVTNGDAYGYLPFTNGVSLQDTYIETTVLGEPGVVAPGQSIFVIAFPEAPENTPPVFSVETGYPVAYNVEVGSNVTAQLVSQSGKVVASEPLFLNSYLSNVETIQGALTVPTGITPGLYDVVLNSTFKSVDLDAYINGSFFGQVYVASAASVPSISLSTTQPYEGQVVTVNAQIAYPNGTSVKYGLYSGALYPKDLQNYYGELSADVPFDLTYDASTGYWTANVTLPSAYNSGGSLQVDQGALYLSGPYEVFLTGFSADGVPTDTDISTQAQLQVQPYYYLSDVSLTSLPQTSDVAFAGDTIIGPPPSARAASPLTLNGDVFIGQNTLQGGTVTISQSQIQGTLTLNDAEVTLVGVSGGSVVATGSSVTLRDSSLSSLSLTDSVVSANASTLGAVTPSLPTVTIQAPQAGSLFTGSTGSVSVSGQDITSVSVFLDGKLLQSSNVSSTLSFPLVSTSLTVGVHEIEVTAAQRDGLSTSSVVYFSTDGPLVAENNSISSVSTSLSSVSTTLGTVSASLGSVSASVGAVNSTVGALSGRVSSQQSTIQSLSSELNSAKEGIYALAIVAVLALIIGSIAVARRPRLQPPAAPPPESAAPTGQQGPS